MSITRKLAVVDDNEDGTLLKVAFATSDQITVDQHFGSAHAFSIYGVNPENAYLLEVSEFGDLKQDGNEDKLAEKLEMLRGCVAVYCRACGASAVRQLLVLGIQPVKVSDGTEISEMLINLQQELREGPSAWLAKAIRSQQHLNPNRFDTMESEGWSE
ncbi:MULTISPECIES: NifB/NifX family molybdenum-iron cluster-binding protein [unclassified Oceanobacter]|uniref:NifB/NifX family molybdenum-iron cluster-binding protein n=1 Tax=unclassified Oceanobacter TaxID=2620260 RepID=UPI0026E148A0|nr:MULTISPECIES: NifB/NifX family molybdenum-iron cluster-binding protein [unclassified Oceanobacter]MDO6682721.1 NifB/NifX family molybdenum-iron cluster-binding protein [Oceanobacter sp. 5_MG-2023]MDP2507199.1 NifB/NifX family molybdenum-iron cluster-binding protein [Oceanobacter sp. 3_MG-2023]MDP2549131.1 NifB/NifX family molybdenum-iron cluster-binding protein [Oceanobacter sp. 4_MG-2023]MDP2609041.1 NifB/NifX family molybdenum-iron cluster-binding protein [Oceanobacter sp. 1_MG-2023]MDP26